MAGLWVPNFDSGNLRVTLRDDSSGAAAPSFQLKDGTGKAATLDAFGRLRASNPFTLFDSKQIYDDNPLFFDTSTTGAGAVTHNANRSSSELTTSTASGDIAIRQTKRYFNYSPGKSLEVIVTYNFEAEDANVRKRVGYFDANDGIFLELDGSDLYLVRRSSVSGSPVDTRVAQSAWSGDSLDGTGDSGVTLDNTKSQILVIDVQWLGVGEVRCGFDIDGKTHIVHQFTYANEGGDVYMKTPNLPLRWEIENTGTASGTPQLTAICGTVIVEGGLDEFGIIRSADRAVSGTSIGGSLEPVISIRLKSAYNRATVIPKSMSIIATGGGNFYWQLAINPTITGGTAASWAAVTNSAVEYDVAQNGTASAGTVIASGYASTASDIGEVSLQSLLYLASDIAGTSDILTLSAQKIGGGSETILGGLGWLEVA